MGLYGGPRSLYGDFSGKTEAVEKAVVGKGGGNPIAVEDAEANRRKRQRENRAEITATLKELYREAVSGSVAVPVERADIARVVAPYRPRRAEVLPPAEQIDWNALLRGPQQEIDEIGSLLGDIATRRRAERAESATVKAAIAAEQDDEDALVAMLMLA